VESATPLPADLRAEVTGQLEKIYGSAVNITFSENPALLGGLRIQVGSDLYDGSVQTRLEKLEQSF
jgi:F-type H+-transporting ATPase subunit delta